MDACVVFIPRLLWTMLQWTREWRYLFEIISLTLNIHISRREIAGSYAGSVLISGFHYDRTSLISTDSVQEFPCATSSLAFVTLIVLMTATLAGMRWHLTVVLIFIFLMSQLAIRMSSLKKKLLFRCFCPFFSCDFFFAIEWFWILISCQPCGL